MTAAMWHAFSLWHPELVLMVLLLGWLYFHATAQFRPATSPKPEAKSRLPFVLFLLVAYIAMGSPVAFLAQNRFFFVFIIQSLLMTLVMPWLLLASIPPWMYSSAFRINWLYRTFRLLTRPLVALILYNGFATLFLVPSVFEANLDMNWLHIVDQTVLMVSAIFLWWPLVNPSTELPRLGRGWQLFYILFGTNFMMPVPVLLLIAHNPWYSTYLSSAGSAHSFNALADQQLGGILMIVGMIVVYGIRAVATYAAYDGQKWYE